jgi:hypothetical protein
VRASHTLVSSVHAVRVQTWNESAGLLATAPIGRLALDDDDLEATSRARSASSIQDGLAEG